MSKLIYIDVETGGLDHKIHPLLQISCIVEIDGVVKEVFDRTIEATDDDVLDKEALEITGYKRGVDGQDPTRVVYLAFKKMLARYVDPYNRLDKFYMVTYNGQAFDIQFIRSWFEKQDDAFMGSWFYYPCVDVMLMAAFMCIGQRHLLGDFKLMTVAKSLGIEVDNAKLHDAMYDIELTKEVFDIIRKEVN